MKRFTLLFASILLTIPVFATDITINTDTDYDKATYDGNNLIITGGSTLTFQDCTPATSSTMVFTLGDSAVEGDTGNITFNMTTPQPSANPTEANCIALKDGNVTFNGKGVITIQGGGDVATYTGGDSQLSSITFALANGSQINVTAGRLINGHWGFQHWDQNQADLYLAEGATLDLWDGASVYVNALNGAGTITPNGRTPRGPMYIGNGDGSGTFDGTIQSNAKIIKVGTGTQTFTGQNSQLSLQVSNGTVELTGNGLPAGAGNTVTVDEGATLKISNAYNFNNKFTGKGTVEYANSEADYTFSAANITNFADFEGTLQIDTKLFYVAGNITNDKMTISLNGGDLRNRDTTRTVATNLRIDSASGGLHPGWGKQQLIITGKVSDGLADTLNIVADSNTGDNASWVVLSNPNNDYTNTVVNHYLKVTATGALGTGKVTINSGKVLDLTNTTIDASRLANSGTITSSSTDAPAVITMNGANLGGTLSGNVQLILTGEKSTLRNTSSATGGVLIQNMANNNASMASGLGTGTLTLDNGLLMNVDRGLGLYQPVVVTSKGGSLRAGYLTSQGGLGSTGGISGEGKLTLNYGEGNSAPITMAGENTYTGGTAIVGGGTNLIYIASNSPFGTGQVDASTNTTVFSFLTSGNYARSYFSGNFNLNDSIAVSNISMNMDDTANMFNNTTVWTANNTTYSYNTTIQTEETTTLEFGKHFDDSVAIFVTNLNTGEKTTVMNVKEGWTVKSYGTFTFEAGVPYEIDVRLGQGSGGVGVAQNDTLNGLNDDPDDLVGVGVRVAGTTDKFQRLTIFEDGNWAFTDGSVKTVGRDWELPNDLKIAAKTIQVKNTGMGNATLSGKITGTGTLAVSNTSELADDLTGMVIFNGAPATAADTFNVTVADGTKFSGNGTIGGNLTMASGSCLVLDETQDLGKLTVSGTFNAQGATLNVTQTTPDSEIKITANAADLTGATINYTYNGDVSELDDFATVQIVDANNLAGFDSLTFNFASDTGAILSRYWVDGGALYAQLGNTSSIPEPSTLLLALLAVGGVFGLRKSRRATLK